jgi:hypothetical protein
MPLKDYFSPMIWDMAKKQLIVIQINAAEH